MIAQVWIYLNGSIQVRQKDNKVFIPKYNNLKHLHKLLDDVKKNRESEDYTSIRDLEYALVRENERDKSLEFITIKESEIKELLTFIKK